MKLGGELEQHLPLPYFPHQVQVRVSSLLLEEAVSLQSWDP